MLIWLDDSVIACVEGDSDSDLIFSGLSSILHAAQRGDHFVLGSRSVLDAIAKAPALAQWEKRMAATLAQKFTVLSGLSKKFSSRIVIVNSEGPAIERDPPFAWKIQLREIGRTGLGRAVLVAEDIVDCQLMCYAGRHYLFQIEANGNVEIRLDGRMAGGKGNAFRQFRSLLETARDLCLCITDSDRIAPDSKQTGSGRHLKKLPQRFEASAVAKYEELPVRELENLIPFRIINEALLNEVPDAYHKWHNMLVERDSPEEVIQHADLKLGTSFWSIQRLSSGSAGRLFWEAELARLQKKGVNTIDPDCPDCKPCPRRENRNGMCGCLVTDPIIEGLAEVVLNYLEKSSPHKGYELVKNSQNVGGWLSIGKTIAEWGCAYKLQRI